MRLDKSFRPYLKRFLSREAIKTTEGQIGDLIKNLNKENSTILPALINPKPLLAQPVPTGVNDAGPTG